MNWRFLLLSAVLPAALLLSHSARACAPDPPQNTNEQTQAGKAGAQTPQKSNAAKPANSEPPKLTFVDVPRDAWPYAYVSDMQAQGLLVKFEYPEGYFRGLRPLTRYEFAVAMQRILSQMLVSTLSADGKKLQLTFGIPHFLTREQAQQVVRLCKEFRPELDWLQDKREHVRPEQVALGLRTLQAYIDRVPLDPDTLPEFAPSSDTPAKTSGGAETKPDSKSDGRPDNKPDAKDKQP